MVSMFFQSAISTSSEVCYQLHILEAFRPGLKYLEQFSHVKVYWWGNQTDNREMRSKLQAELPYAHGITAGVFACAVVEYRPNPILETICYILDIDHEQGIVHIVWIDGFDNTPVLDLKPYIPMSDRVRDVRVADWLSELPDCMEDAAEFFATVGEGYFD